MGNYAHPVKVCCSTSFQKLDIKDFLLKEVSAGLNNVFDLKITPALDDEAVLPGQLCNLNLQSTQREEKRGSGKGRYCLQANQPHEIGKGCIITAVTLSA
jgi:hypothetical protein